MRGGGVSKKILRWENSVIPYETIKRPETVCLSLLCKVINVVKRLVRNCATVAETFKIGNSRQPANLQKIIRNPTDKYLQGRILV